MLDVSYLLIKVDIIGDKISDTCFKILTVNERTSSALFFKDNTILFTWAL